jgi:hypothetical protein
MWFDLFFLILFVSFGCQLWKFQFIYSANLGALETETNENILDESDFSDGALPLLPIFSGGCLCNF